MEEVSVTVIGAGVVGLSVAAELAKRCDGVVVLERHDAFGRETSSRNSEVIHAGLYYPPGSLKAGLCVSGARMLYEYAAERGIPHKKTGKLVVARGYDGLYGLESLLSNARENGVKDLRIIDAGEAARMEPSVIADWALHSPDTGIINTHSLMSALISDAESAGAVVSFGSEVTSIEKTGGGYIVGLSREDFRFMSRVVVNCAGLFADKVASLSGIDIDSAGYRQRYCKGSYFSYSKPSPVNMLVYPLPHEDLAGLGVHATIDIAGRLRFGPDAEYCEAIEYTVEGSRREAFYRGASEIIAGLDIDAFIPDMSGVRPKLAGSGVQDFILADESGRGLDGFINLVGIESPGLTASLAIAKHVRGMVGDIIG